MMIDHLTVYRLTPVDKGLTIGFLQHNTGKQLVHVTWDTEAVNKYFHNGNQSGETKVDIVYNTRVPSIDHLLSYGQNYM
jgi:hypothetical protein